MFVDYQFYIDTFKGNLSEEEFNRYVTISSNSISKETCSRVRDGTINSFPSELVKDIKLCACALVEKFKSFYDFFDIVSANGGVLRSKTAGAVSVSYDTSSSLSYLLDPKNQETQIKSIINAYLFLRCINGRFYNLLSKVLDNTSHCDTCCIV